MIAVSISQNLVVFQYGMMAISITLNALASHLPSQWTTSCSKTNTKATAIQFEHAMTAVDLWMAAAHPGSCCMTKGSVWSREEEALSQVEW